MDLIGIPELDFSTQNLELIYKGIEEIMTMEENIEGEVECEFINNSFEPYAENFIGINASHLIKSDFQDNYGTVNLTGHGSAKNNFSFNVNAKAMFTPQNFGLTAYIFRDDKKMNTDLKNRLEKISLLKK